jgi:hypothetical protein
MGRKANPVESLMSQESDTAQSELRFSIPGAANWQGFILLALVQLVGPAEVLLC